MQKHKMLHHLVLQVEEELALPSSWNEPDIGQDRVSELLRVLVRAHRPVRRGFFEVEGPRALADLFSLSSFTWNTKAL